MSDDMQPGPELDRLVAEKVMGWRDINRRSWYFGPPQEYRGHRSMSKWSPSTNIAHAWEVVEKLSKNGWEFTLDSAPDELGNWCTGWFFAGIGKYTARALGAPHAICLAALKAVGAIHD